MMASTYPHSANTHRANSFWMRTYMQYFRHISNLILLVALFVGLYARWAQNHNTFIIFISVVSCFAFTLSAAMIYYCSMQTMGYCIFRLWVGCLLGIVSYTNEDIHRYSSEEEVMNSLFLSSLIVRCSLNVIERVRQAKSVTSSMDMMEVFGVCVASLIFGNDFMAVSLLVLALALTVQAIRLKSFLAVLNLCILCVLAASKFFPEILQKHVNPFPLVCFVGRMAFEPIIDLYFSNLTLLERWTPIFITSALWRRLMILLIVIMEVTFYAFCAKQIPHHKEWFIVVPMFAAFSLVWWSYHIVFVITIWQLNNKITDCCTAGRMTSQEGSNSLSLSLAARGVRHFSLIAKNLVSIALISTITLTGLGWITHSAVSLAILLMVVPVEVVIMSLLWELGRILGGTCTGYALVAPITPHTRDQSPKVLPVTAVQEMSLRATTTLNQMQHFLSYHIIDQFGCDYTSSGLTQDSIEEKLRGFFQRVTVDGPNFDTYLVYYSGHAYDTGDWALAENGQLKLQGIIDLWREYHTGTGARLILLLDTVTSHRWVGQLRRYNDVAIAIQTCKAVKPKSEDPEVGSGFKVGDFTHDWVAFNCGSDNSLLGGLDPDWRSPDRVLRAMYEVSRGWADFSFRMPTKEDVTKHCDSNFPRFTKPLLTITNFPQFSQVFCCSDWLLRCLRRLRLRWLPPLNLDTGHGFKLVHS